MKCIEVNFNTKQGLWVLTNKIIGLFKRSSFLLICFSTLLFSHLSSAENMQLVMGEVAKTSTLVTVQTSRSFDTDFQLGDTIKLQRRDKADVDLVVVKAKLGSSQGIRKIEAVSPSGDRLLLTYDDLAVYGTLVGKSMHYSITADKQGGLIFSDALHPSYEHQEHQDDVIVPEESMTIEDLMKSMPVDKRNLLEKRMREQSQLSASAKIASNSQAHKSIIKMLVVYSDEFAESYTSPVARIESLVDFLTSAMEQTGVDAEFTVAHAAQIGFDNDALLGSILDSATDQIGDFENVGELRNEFSADMVAVLRLGRAENTPESAVGLAFLGFGNASFAFSVNTIRPEVEAFSIASDNRIFAHEIGHNMGSSHLREQSNFGTQSLCTDTNNFTGFSCGHQGAGFSTIMNGVGGGNVPHYSNPNLDCSGEPCGIPEGSPDAADNFTSFNRFRLLAELFRGDDDEDGIDEDFDNCPSIANTDQANIDGDAEGDVCDADDDNDNVIDTIDNCPINANTGQADSDGDNIGDVCDGTFNDQDNDTIADAFDNCPAIANTNQANNDGDEFGDACDADIDGDGIVNELNSGNIIDQSFSIDDFDFGRGFFAFGDGGTFSDDVQLGQSFTVGLNGQLEALSLPIRCFSSDVEIELREVDSNSVISDEVIASSLIVSPIDGEFVEIDFRSNNINVLEGQRYAIIASSSGDCGWITAETTSEYPDGSAVLARVRNIFSIFIIDLPFATFVRPSGSDNCPFNANTGQADSDGDNIGDACDDTFNDQDNDTIADLFDNCPAIANTNQTNNDGDSQGDVCDTDDDNDNILDTLDNCPINANTGQADSDGDNIGDACDDTFNDQDDDTVADAFDNCPAIANTNQSNNDGDAEGDACDSDDDNDTVADDQDNCPFDSNVDQENNDLDSLGDVCDSDDDNDSVVDIEDNCPRDSNANQNDTDGDLFGDACDPDDDNDGINDAEDNCPLVENPLQEDEDEDGVGDDCLLTGDDLCLPIVAENQSTVIVCL